MASVMAAQDPEKARLEAAVKAWQTEYEDSAAAVRNLTRQIVSLAQEADDPAKRNEARERIAVRERALLPAEKAKAEAKEALLKAKIALAEYQGRDTAALQVELNRLLGIQTPTAAPSLKPVHPATVELWRDPRAWLQGAAVQLPPDMDAVGHPCLVRESYAALFELFLAQPVKGVLSHNLFGTPGTGKSVCAAMFVFYLRVRAPEAVVFYTSAEKVRGEALAFRPDGTVERVSLVDAREEMYRLDILGQGHVWAVVDGYNASALLARPYQTKRTLVVSSANFADPNTKWLQEWTKIVNHTFVSSPFEYAELLAVNEVRRQCGAPHWNQPELLGRFRVFGGSARLVFNTTVRAAEWLDAAVTRLPAGDGMLRRVLDATRNETVAGEVKSGRILHSYPRDEGREFQQRVLRFASVAVQEKLLNLVNADVLADVRRRVERASVTSDSIELQRLLEPYAHHLFRVRAQFVRADTGEAYVPPLDPATETHVEDDSSPGALHRTAALVRTYVRPQSARFPSVDSWVRLAANGGGAHLYQVTCGAVHEINMPGLLSLFSVPAGTPGSVQYQYAVGRGATRHYQVGHVLVPDDCALLFVVHPASTLQVPQNFGGRAAAGSLTAAAEDYIIARLPQYVLRVPV